MLFYELQMQVLMQVPFNCQYMCWHYVTFCFTLFSKIFKCICWEPRIFFV